MDDLIKQISQSISQEQVDAVNSNSAELSSVFSAGPRIMVAFNPKASSNKPVVNDKSRE